LFNELAALFQKQPIQQQLKHEEYIKTTRKKKKTNRNIKLTTIINYKGYIYKGKKQTLTEQLNN